MTFFQVGAVNSGSKGARTAIMGLGKDIRNLLVVETSAFVSFYLTTKVLDLLSSQNCTKSSADALRELRGNQILREYAAHSQLVQPFNSDIYILRIQNLSVARSRKACMSLHRVSFWHLVRK